MHIDKEYSRELLDEGDVIEIIDGTVMATVPFHFMNKPGEWGRGVFDKFAHTEVELSKCEWFKGTYVVYKAQYEPGGESSHDLHPIQGPDEYHVYCERLQASERERIENLNADLTGTRIDFFQIGEDGPMQYDVKVVGKAEIKYELKK